MQATSSVLKRHKLRSTLVRRMVIEVLQDSRAALSATELEEQVSSDRVTMYRTLKTFEETGIVHRVQDGTGIDKYALCGDSCTSERHAHAHPHFRCQRCEQTLCLQDVEVLKPALPTGFAIDNIQLTYHGLCQSCNAPQS